MSTMRWLCLLVAGFALVGCQGLAPHTWPAPPLVRSGPVATIPPRFDVLTVACHAGTVGCIGRTVSHTGLTFPADRVVVQARHEGAGDFVVTLGYRDGTDAELFRATGAYSSAVRPITTDGIVTMTVQGTGPWSVSFQRASRSLPAP